MKCIRCDIDMLPSDMFGDVCPNCGMTATEQEAAKQKGKQETNGNRPESKRQNRDGIRK
jgi:uncharacterized Zn finger protein (UPF0148 family)